MISRLKKHSFRRLLVVAAVVGLVVLTSVAWLVDPANRHVVNVIR